jgi:hypothetical protein
MSGLRALLCIASLAFGYLSIINNDSLLRRVLVYCCAPKCSYLFLHNRSALIYHYIKLRHALAVVLFLVSCSLYKRDPYVLAIRPVVVGGFVAAVPDRIIVNYFYIFDMLLE